MGINLRKNKITLYALLMIGLALFIMFTSPEKLPAVLLIVPFAAFFFLIFGLVAYILERFYRFTGRKNPVPSRLLPLMVSIVATLILTLSSLGQLTPRDLILVFILSVLASFYISKTRVRSSSSE